MAIITKNIGLSLGADLCWPAAYEALLKELDLQIPVGKNEVRFNCERITVEPYENRTGEGTFRVERHGHVA